MKRFLILCFMIVSPVGLSVLVWVISGNTTACGEGNATHRTAKQLDGISKLLLVRGKSRTEALQLALGSGAKEVVISLWNVDTKTTSGVPVQFDLVEYHIADGRVAETELTVFRRRGQEFIKGVYDRVMAAGKVDRTKTTKQKVFLTIPLRNKQVLRVEMQQPSVDSMYPWRVRFRPGGSIAKPVSASKPAKSAASHPATDADMGHSKVITGIRIPVSVSTKQLKAFLRPRWKSLDAITLRDVSIPFGQGKVVLSERLSYAIARRGGQMGVRSGILGKLECRIREKDQDYKTLMAFVADIRRRGHVTISKYRSFYADVTMPSTGVKGEVYASYLISNPDERAMLAKKGEELLARITITVSPPYKDTDTPATKPAKGKSDK
jgi:hypothetical protein